MVLITTTPDTLKPRTSRATNSIQGETQKPPAEAKQVSDKNQSPATVNTFGLGVSWEMRTKGDLHTKEKPALTTSDTNRHTFTRTRPPVKTLAKDRNSRSLLS